MLCRWGVWEACSLNPVRLVSGAVGALAVGRRNNLRRRSDGLDDNFVLARFSKAQLRAEGFVSRRLPQLRGAVRTHLGCRQPSNRSSISFSKTKQSDSSASLARTAGIAPRGYRGDKFESRV